MPKADSQFRPGQSGNPGGRPKGERSVREMPSNTRPRAWRRWST